MYNKSFVNGKKAENYNINICRRRRSSENKAADIHPSSFDDCNYGILKCIITRIKTEKHNNIIFESSNNNYMCAIQQLFVNLFTYLFAFLSNSSMS